jgi:two-component system OmpR family response regulator
VHRILVIEDDPTGSQLLLTLLELEGYQGSQPDDWADPLRGVGQQRPDLVILDVHLSTLDGFELLRRLRAHGDPGVARTPVLMVSAENLKAQCLSAGADGFVEKPYDLETLLGAIRRSVEGSVSTD